jgi:hypothetical protein
MNDICPNSFSNQVAFWRDWLRAQKRIRQLSNLYDKIYGPGSTETPLPIHLRSCSHCSAAIEPIKKNLETDPKWQALMEKTKIA